MEKSRGRPGRCRRRTVTWCRRATSSSSNDARLRSRNESSEPTADRTAIMAATVWRWYNILARRFRLLSRHSLAAMGIRDHPIAPRSPWQNGHAERLIGSIRRECLDHVVVFGEAHLRRILAAYAGYYNELRTHLSMDKNSPCHRSVQRLGQLAAQPILGGLHHQYGRTGRSIQQGQPLLGGLHHQYCRMSYCRCLRVAITG